MGRVRPARLRSAEASVRAMSRAAVPNVRLEDGMTILSRPKPRRPYRAPAGLPRAREDWRASTSISVLLHVGVIILLLLPLAASEQIRQFAQGAGGPGPAGGGGGGNRGTGANRAESIRFVRVAPQPPPQIPKPEVKVKPPEVKPPQPEPPPVVKPEPEPVKAAEPTMTTGTGG